MAPRKKLSTLVASEPVRFAFNVGRITLQQEEERVVQLKDGSYDRITVPSIVLTRLGAQHEEQVTREYDPNVKADREIIEAVTQLLEDNPNLARDVQIGLQIIGANAPVRPFPSYDSDDITLEGLEHALTNGGYDLAGVMKYELSRVDEDGEPLTRPEVVELIDRIHREQNTKKADQTNQAVDL